MSEDTLPPAATPHDDPIPANAPAQPPDPMTLSKLRHEIRNHLNAVKLCCALIHRQTRDAAARSTVDEVDRAADRIADLVIRYLNDDQAPKLFLQPPGSGRYDQ